MSDLKELLDREARLVEAAPEALESVLHRRDRKRRNQRIAAGFVGIAVFVAAVWMVTDGGWLDRSEVPADQTPSRFVDTWTSTEFYSGSSQTMTIRPAADGALDITLHDDSSWLCSTRQNRLGGVDTPSTLTGTGRLLDATTLVVPSFQVCPSGDALDVGPSTVEERATSYTLVLDVATDRLFDNLGVAWHRGATPENAADTTTECEILEPQVGSPGTCSMLRGEVTFRAAEPWFAHLDSYIDPRLFVLTSGPGLQGRLVTMDATIEILANPNPLPEGPCYRYPRLPASAEALVQAIRSNPDLGVTVPVAERVGRIDALRMDVAPVPGASRCPNGGVPVVSTSNSGWGTMGPAELGRLYVLDLPGGSARTLVIMIMASEAAFERAVEAAAPVVESFEFHAG
jgi:hypothetical protein